jgi:DNA-binding transcriptional MerR regulator
MTRLSISAFATAVGLHRRTIHRYINDKVLVVNRTPGGQPFFTEEQVVDFDKTVFSARAA